MLNSDEVVRRATLAWMTLNLPTHVSATIPAIGKVITTVKGRAMAKELLMK